MKRLEKRKWWKDRDLIFYILMIAFPVFQFVVFYIGVNTSSILQAFQTIDIADNSIQWTFSNIKNAFHMMTQSPEMLTLLPTSLISYFLILGIGTPLGLFFSYYIYKKLPLHGAFRVILFLPSIISAIVMSTIFQFFVERAIPSIVQMTTGTQIMGLMENVDTRFGMIIFYNILMGFGTNVLMYSNSMSGISKEMVEASQIDGASPLREFWHITLPAIFPTLTTFLVAGVATIFSNQLNLFSFYGPNASQEISTYGYYLYVQTLSAKSISEYPLLSAMGLLITVVVVPLTLFVKWALEKYGPRED